jgi:hypothetical protein
MLLTATTPISHHDPAVQDNSNVLLFNRQKQLLPIESLSSTELSADAIKNLCERNPVPNTIADIFTDLTPHEFVACVSVRLFLDIYNTTEGSGLFAGLERYEMLESRLRAAAVRSNNLREFWSRLCRDLLVDIQPGEHDHELITLFALPAGFQRLVLRTLVNHYRHIVMIARCWHTDAKSAVAEYADAAGREQTQMVVPTLAQQEPNNNERAIILDVPSVSANTLRHQIVREPGWLHLAGMLGLVEGEPGKAEVPIGVEAIFLNGGNIEAGAKQPTNPFWLANEARKHYPLLDLLGGVADSFDLGESRLSVAAWLVCRENRAALIGSPAADLPAASVSIFDLLDDVTHTRQATEHGVGQMIYNFETLAPGAQIVCRFALSPYTRRLTCGAFVAACDTFVSSVQTIAGQSARGYGYMFSEWLRPLEDAAELRAEYESYLRDNAAQLAEWLRDGTLGTGTKILS